MPAGRPVDEVGGEHDGEGVWFVAGGYCGQVYVYGVLGTSAIIQ